MTVGDGITNEMILKLPKSCIRSFSIFVSTLEF